MHERVAAALGRRVVVVGGAAEDLTGRPDSALVRHDSNPGRIRSYAGGVGRNIAENLARLGARAELITAVGGDEAGREIISACALAGVGLTGTRRIPELPSARNLIITDEQGHCELSLGDRRVLDQLTGKVVAEPILRALLDAAEVVVLDADLSVETLEAVADYVRVPLVLDAVSAMKAMRLLSVLARAGALACTAREAAALLDERTVPTSHDAADVLARLQALGPKCVYVSFGEDGVYWASEEATGRVQVPGLGRVCTSGAGDAFTAGVAFGMLGGVGAEVCARLGAAVYALTLVSDATVNPELTLEAVLEVAKRDAAGHSW